MAPVGEGKAPAKPKGAEVFGCLLLIALIVGGAAAAKRIYARYQETSCTDRVIIVIGECDGEAKCGVGYSDGTYGVHSYPVPYQKVSVCEPKKFMDAISPRRIGVVQ